MVKRSQHQIIGQRVLAILEQHPTGVDVHAIRRELGLQADEQQQLDRRIRELDATHVIERRRDGIRTLYVLHGEKDASQVTDTVPIDKTTRARILHLSGGRCQMCGRTVAEDHVRLHIDHRIPREWGGLTVEWNLWALCSECNEGKRNFFASITDERVRQAITHHSIHMRIGELLKAFGVGVPVPKMYLQLVAHTHEDWEKRMRELRELGWRYSFRKARDQGNRVRVEFILEHWEPWPYDIQAAIRASETRKGTKRGSG